jgi:SAM-dependent methyltransferase
VPSIVAGWPQGRPRVLVVRGDGRGDEESSRGDRDERWRRSYLRGRKDLFVGEASSNRRRLDTMGVDGRLHGTWLDLGAGDGNLSALLARRGVDAVVALEYQEELLRHADVTARVVGDAAELPLATSSVDAVVVMDALHHLRFDRVAVCLAEVARVLRPGGPLFVCEPAPTVARSVLQRALDSPLGSLTAFSRDKRTMVELEADTLFPWLDREPGFVSLVGDHGFDLELTARRPLHTMRRFRQRCNDID